ncbi:LRR receptor-like serine/threonine-protein kinase GSO1-like [Planoprotostelium fungivorum]|uniref:LRR receptor-like serine/threonine-protein kinase GSO1-like n=1 Tax=Planoprotostelium fungivorum TaxID=1890364 RepID=A0A2P6NVK7_9EUKA|nr:LRR receptor-like serine/threonine-protein kinase GSO1-like [Planoprotostelium fungivorum]
MQYWLVVVVKRCLSKTEEIYENSIAQLEVTLMVMPELTGIGATWYNSTGWKNGSDHCTFFGITCDSQRRIVGLELPNNNLKGALPRKIWASLPDLEKVNLADNLLRDRIHSGLLTLQNLKHLQLNNNSFSELGSTTPPPLQLEYINLMDNQLQSFDQLTRQICKMTKLKALFLSNSPTALSINQCINGLVDLTHLVLRNMSIEGVVPQITMSKLRVLDMSHNLLQGEIPQDIFLRCTELEEVYIQYNLFTGGFPSFGLYPSLLHLDASHNQFTSMPSNFSGAYNIESICFHSNEIYGWLTEELFSNLDNLTKICMGDNHFNGSLPSFRQLKSLKTLSASANSFTGEIPPLPLSLVELHLFENQLNGTLSSLSYLPLLEIIDLSFNLLEGNITQELMDLPSISQIDLTSNLLRGDIIPPSINSSIQVLLLGQNQFSGIIPTMENLTSLNHLDVSYNALVGHLPNMPRNLKKFIASANLFEGDASNCTTLPHLTEMEHLDLSFNHITGQIMHYLKDWNNLTVLNLRNNGFYDEFPAINPLTSKLKEIHLDNCNFSGYFNWTNLKSLTSLTLSNNNFNGSISSRAPINLTELDLSNNYFEGETKFLPHLPNLVSMDLSLNQFSGQIFAQDHLRPRSESLTYLNIRGNNFSGALFPNLPSSIVLLDACYNQFSEHAVPTKNKLKSAMTWPLMLQCYVANNDLGGNLLSLFSEARFPKLIDLNLSNNTLRGPLPPTLSQLTQLNSLVLDYNELEGEIPSFFNRMTQLRNLSLSHNGLWASNLSMFTTMAQLEVLNLSHNHIHSEIPAEINNLKNLMELDLSHNQIHGELPGMMMPKINKLILSHNHLKGNITEMSCDPYVLDLSHNQFNGPVLFLLRLISIQHLDIAHNSFTGELPSLSHQSRLLHVNLSRNELWGELPKLQAFPQLQNKFQGTIPYINTMLELKYLDLSHNNLSDPSITGQPLNITICKMNHNPLVCPMMKSISKLCDATCDRQLNGEGRDDGDDTLRIKIEGDINHFDSQAFLSSTSHSFEIEASRLKIVGLRPGSVIIDLKIEATSKPHEATASRIAQQMFNLSFLPNNPWISTNLTVLSIIYPIPPTQSDRRPLPPGAIAGIVVGTLLLTVIIVLLSFIIRKRRIRRRMTAQKYVIDINNIDFGESKASIVPFAELEDMRLIGAGNFGVVFQAQWRNLNVAVKQIRAEYVTESQLNEFLHEVSILRRLRAHPNVVLLEYCEGGSLYTYLRKDPVDMDVKRHFVRGIALGMLHLHKENIIHRDLAVRNILLTKHLDPKVCDFGLSREVSAPDSASLTSSISGPVKWISPEAIMHKQYSTKSDVFSFGVVIWEILTQSDPWPELTLMECAFVVVTENKRLSLQPYFPPDLQTLMTECWKKEPEERPSFNEICEQVFPEIVERKKTRAAAMTRRHKETKSPERSVTFAGPSNMYVDETLSKLPQSIYCTSNSPPTEELPLMEHYQ